MTIKALHIYATNGSTNSGDYFLGPSTKWRFEQIMNSSVNWQNFNVRKQVTDNDVAFFNTFDYVIVGGGGLMLPDTNPNNVSCWQWAISREKIEKIETKIYVIGIGLNWFFGQNITMPSRVSSKSEPERKEIFDKNIDTLVKKSEYFSMRHEGDVQELINYSNLEHKEKIFFEFCPVLEYTKQKYANGFNSGEFITFEIKDDRPERRYLGTSKNNFYKTLHSYMVHLKNNGEKLAVMSHDGSSTFMNYLNFKGFRDFKVLNNTVANEKKIIENYSKVKKLYCTAGHSQIMAHALGLDNYSLIGHNKLYYFLQDTNRTIPKHGMFVRDLTLNDLLNSHKGSR
jgi:hypothetical protein